MIYHKSSRTYCETYRRSNIDLELIGEHCFDNFNFWKRKKQKYRKKFDDNFSLEKRISA